MMVDANIPTEELIKIINNDFVTVEDGSLRHDVIKLSLQIFSYLLMR